MKLHKESLLSWSREEKLAWADRVDRSLRVASKGFMEADLSLEGRGKMVWRPADKEGFPLWLPVALLARAVSRYFELVVAEDRLLPEEKM